MTTQPRRGWSFLGGALALSTLLSVVFGEWAPPAMAQRAAVPPAVRGRGLELEVIGGTSFVPGDEVQLAVTTYEVRGGLALTRLPNAAIVTSIREHVAPAPGAVPTATTSDADGRALLRVATTPSDDAERTLDILVRAPAGDIERRFSVRLTPRPRAMLAIALSDVDGRRDGELAVVGRAADVVTGAPRAHEEVRITFEEPEGQVVLSAVTDAQGFFVVRRDTEQGGRVLATLVAHDEVGAATATYEPRREPSTALRVELEAERVVVRPGERVTVTARVRRPNGRPVREATLDIEEGWLVDEAPSTDDQGRATFVVQAPSTGESARDASMRVGAASARGQEGATSLTFRIATIDRVLDVEVEDDAITNGVGGRVRVLSREIDGTPTPSGHELRLTLEEGPTVGARTDDRGRAWFDVPWIDPAQRRGTRAATHACGGDAIAATLSSAGSPDDVRCLPIDRHRPLHVSGDASTLRIAHSAASRRFGLLVIAESVRGDLLAVRRLPAATTQFDLRLPDTHDDVLVHVRLVDADGRTARGDSLRLVGSEHAMEGGASDETLVVPAGGQAFVWRGADTATEGALLALVSGSRTASGARPIDHAAPFVLEGDRLVPAVDAAAWRAPRDPWRAHQRVRTGRLALALRTIDERISHELVTHPDDVSVLLGDRRQLHPDILDSSGIAERLVDLSGAPLDLATLVAWDPTITFDNVARRITRRRLYAVLGALRDFLDEHELDDATLRVRAPERWIEAAIEDGVSSEVLGEQDASEIALDGWGHPFELVPHRGAALPFQPVEGFVVVSRGPDGRLGTADDLRDPTVRVLASGTPFAVAVDEDRVVAGLARGIAGRLLFQALGDEPPPRVHEDELDYIFDEGELDGASYEETSVQIDEEGEDESVRAEAWPPLPTTAGRSPFASTAHTLRVAGPGTHTFDDTDGAGDPVPSRALVVDAGGRVRLVRHEPTRHRSLAIEPWGVEAIEAGETLRVPLDLTNLDRVAHHLAIELRGGDDRNATLTLEEGDETIDAEGTLRRMVAVTGHAPGRVALTIVVRLLDDGGRETAVRAALRVDPPGIPLRTRVAARVTTDWEATLRTPTDRDGGAVRVVLLDGHALPRDPDLSTARRTEGALVALGAQRSTGRTFAERDLTSMAGSMPALGALAARVLRGEVNGRARSDSDAMASIVPDAIPEHGALRSHAATLLLVARDGVPALGAEDAPSTLPLVAALSGSLSAILDEPSLLARGAAALLSFDPEHRVGRAMLERARRAIATESRHGRDVGRVLPSTRRDGVLERVVGSLALAIALERAGEVDAAHQLAAAAAIDDHLVVAEGGEALLYWLEAASRGLLASHDERRETRVTVDGATTRAIFSDGVAIVELPACTARCETRHVRIENEGAPVFVRAEMLSVGRDQSATTHGPLDVRVRLHAFDDDASLEISTRATRDVARPMLLVELPTGIDVDELARDLAHASGVVDVTPVAPLALRVTLAPQESGRELLLTGHVVHRVDGARMGFAVVAFDRDAPEARSAVPPIEVTGAAAMP